MRLHIRLLYPWLPLFAFWIIAVASRYLFNGLVYELDFGVYQPDGIWYSLRTLQWSGVSSSQAASDLVNWYSTYSAKNLQYAVKDIYPIPPEIWGLVAPRVLYSLLSIPFVIVFGLKGMLVIPSLSLLALMVSTVLIGKKFNHLNLGFALAIFFSTSPTILRWSVSNTTDSLLLGLFSIIALLTVKLQSNPKLLPVILLLVVLTNLTRVSTPIWIAISLVLLINSGKWSAIWIGAVNLLSSLPILLMRPKIALLPLQQNDDFLTKLLSLPKSLLKVGFFEIAELAVLDRLFLVYLLMALVGALTNIRNLNSMYFIGVLLAVWVLGAINGNIGVNFRYQLPLIPFAIIPFILGLTNFRQRNIRRTLNVIREKTQ